MSRPARYGPKHLRWTAGNTMTGGWLCVLLGGCAVPPPRPVAPSPRDSAFASLQLEAILRSYWQYAIDEWPQYRVWTGLPVNRLPNPALDELKARASLARTVLRALDAMSVEALDEPSYVSWLVLHWDMMSLGGTAAFYWTDLSSLSPARSPLTVSLDLLRHTEIASAGDAQRYQFLLDAFALLVDSVRAGLEARAGRGITIPRLLLPRTSSYLRSFVAPLDSSPLVPAPSRLLVLDAVARAQFRVSLGESLSLRVHPAIERLIAYLQGTYANQATERLGLWQYAGGKEHYRFLVRQYSTLDISPEEAHAVGLREVARLDSAVQQARAQAGYPSGIDAVRSRLQSDPRYRARTPDEIVDHILSTYGRMATRMGRAFNRGTELTADLEALPRGAEASGALGVYAPPSVSDVQGHYLFNAARWNARTLLSLPAYVYRDLLPGRHYQAALQRENAALPPFRRLADHAGFVEGWNAYAIELADSLGAPADAEERFGAVLTELAIACGLVVDSGINYFGWSREEAMAFLRRHLPDTDDELQREFVEPSVDLPGSLTAAALGARELRGLKRWVQQTLGDRFDARTFHDEMLSLGSVPLPVLGTHLEYWLWQTRNRTAADTTKRPPSAFAPAPKGGRSAAQGARGAGTAAVAMVPGLRFLWGRLFP